MSGQWISAGREYAAGQPWIGQCTQPETMMAATACDLTDEYAIRQSEPS